jgi:hypothetical protein
VLFVISEYLDKLNFGGVLIVEDCQDPENWLVQISKLVSNRFTITTKDLREGGYDNFLIVIKKNE